MNKKKKSEKERNGNKNDNNKIGDWPSSQQSRNLHSFLILWQSFMRTQKEVVIIILKGKDDRYMLSRCHTFNEPLWGNKPSTKYNIFINFKIISAFT